MILDYLQSVLILLLCKILECQSVIDVKSTLVWGPGLKTEVVLPARYFFIQAVDDNGLNISKSLGDKPFAVNIYQGDGQRFRVWTQVLDRNDGSYLVRYKLYSTVKDLKIDVLANGKHVAQSPYLLPGDVYNEQCNCPQPKLHKWLKDMNCPNHYKQIKLDLGPFTKIDMDVVEKLAVARFSQKGRHSLCHYVIKDNKVYRKTHGNIVDFKMFMDAILLSLTRKVQMPDVEFFVNLGDWPLEKRTIKEEPLPIFSWCGSDDTKDIIMPTYDITESTLEAMGRVSLDMLSVQGNTGPRWENKSDLAFWRGRDSRKERLELVKLARKNPDIIDAKLTNMFFFKHEEDLGDVVKAISFYDFFKHKYQLNIDGTVAAYRLPYLLAADSVVLKQQSQYYEFFYKQLKPWEHYIPLNANLSDILDKIQWAKDHDQEAKEIGLNAQKLVRENVMPTDVFCYHVVLFKEYAKRLLNPPYVREGMEEVKQPISGEAECTCNRKKPKIKKVTDEL